VIRAPAEYEASLTSADAWIPPARPEERDEATAYLTRLAGWGVLAGIPTEIHIRPGPVAPLLLRLVREEAVDFVVMTSHGRGGLSRWLMGSVATAVARESTAPVLVARANPRFTDPLPAHGVSGSPFRAIVALDGSALAEAALQPAARLVAALSAARPGTLCLLRVVDIAPFTASAAYASGVPGGAELVADARTALVREAHDYLEATAARLRTQPWTAGLTISTMVVGGENVADAIVSAADGRASENGTSEPADLIVLATHGHGGLRRLVAGSVAGALLSKARTSLLVVRPTAGSASALSDVTGATRAAHAEAAEASDASDVSDASAR
jgi:nucleotide-binding universal stress UspA family protein